MARYRVGSERIYRIVKKGGTKGKPVLFISGTPLHDAIYSHSNEEYVDGFTLELVKDFDVVEPVTAEDAVRIAKEVLGYVHTMHNSVPPGKCGWKCCTQALDILERAGER